MAGPLAEAAADYLSRGLAIIALTGKMPNGKVHRHGLNDCIIGPMRDHIPPAHEVMEDENDCPGCADIALIDYAFGHPDTTGVGILTSFPLVVVDLDSETGARNWADLVGEEDMTQGAWVAKTGKGAHLYFGTFLETGTFKLFGNEGGVDLKGNGGYVVAPPSAHPDGGKYEWVVAPGNALMTAPPELDALIQRHLSDAKGWAEGRAVRKPVRGKRYEEGDTVFYAQVGFDGVIRQMKEAPEGNRNHLLYWAAMTLTEEGADDDDFEMLREAALAAGLEPVEVKRTIRSARR